MKNVFCLLLACILLLFGCAKQPPAETAATESAAVTTTAEPETTGPVLTPWESLDGQSFDGAEFIILDNNQYASMHVNIPGPELNGEIVNDALYNRDITVAARFNVVIKYLQYNGMSQSINSILAGDKSFHLIYSQIYKSHLDAAVNNGVLADLCSMDDLSLGEKWWSPLIYEQLCLNGKLYYTAGDIAPGIYQAPLCMFMNLGLYKDMNIKTDVWQLVLDGKWTLDAVAELTDSMNSDLNEDGKFTADKDFFGIAMLPTEEAGNAFVAGAGVRYCRLTADKKNIERADLESSRIVDAVEKIRKFATPIEYNSLNDIITKAFVENRALFLQHKLESAAVHLRNMDNDFLVLPVPMFDEEQDHYISCVSGFVSAFVGIPITFAADDFTGFTTEALARYSGEFIRPQAYEAVYKLKTARDPRTAEVLDIIFDTLYLDFGITNDFGSLSYKYRDMIFNDYPVVSTLTAVNSQIDEQIADLVKSRK